jgi:hypothetical protein
MLKIDSSKISKAREIWWHPLASGGGLHEHCKSTEVIGPRKTITQASVMPIEPTIPFKLCRKQFSINIVFAMTLNKALGQTPKRAKIHHPSPVFPHGQLYVAFLMLYI